VLQLSLLSGLVRRNRGLQIVLAVLDKPYLIGRIHSMQRTKLQMLLVVAVLPLPLSFKIQLWLPLQLLSRLLPLVS
jgi:hypothetical protein